MLFMMTVELVPSIGIGDMKRRSLVAVLMSCAAGLGLAACGSSGSGSSKSLTLVAYSTPQGVFEKLIPAFQATPAGKGVSFKRSYGPSGEQSRAVTNGLFRLYTLLPDPGTPSEVLLFLPQREVVRPLLDALDDPDKFAKAVHPTQDD